MALERERKSQASEDTSAHVIKWTRGPEEATVTQQKLTEETRMHSASCVSIIAVGGTVF